VRPGQWVYWQEKTVTAPGKAAGPAGHETFQVWTMAGGPFRIFCVLGLLADPRHLLLRSLPPLSAQHARPPAHRAVAINVRPVMPSARTQLSFDQCCLCRV